MEHILLDPTTNYQYVDMTLHVMDVKILYNACIDIINEHPEMVGYRRTAEKLKMVLDNITCPTSKSCSKCGEIKPLDSYYKDARQKSGYKPECKECGNTEKAKARKKKWAEDNKEYMRNYRNENKEHINSLIETFHEKNPNYHKERRQKIKLNKNK